MAKVGKVLAFERRVEDGLSKEYVQIDPGGGATEWIEWVTPGGDDAPPQAGDYVALIPAPGRGVLQAVASTDSTTKEASAGEKRLYSRDENGLVTGYVWLKTDGTIQAGNTNAMVQVSAAGVISLLGDDVRLGNNAGRGIAMLGDAVLVAVPVLLSGAPGSAVVPVPPTAANPDGTTAAVGRIVSASSKVKGAT